VGPDSRVGYGQAHSCWFWAVDVTSCLAVRRQPYGCDVPQEYVASQDHSEATRCLRVLAVPFFHHELVKQALLIAMQEPSTEPAMLGLFASVTESGIVSLSQMVKVSPLRLRQIACCTHSFTHWLALWTCGTCFAPTWILPALSACILERMGKVNHRSCTKIRLDCWIVGQGVYSINTDKD
jgi:hypothetical protein